MNGSDQEGAWNTFLDMVKNDARVTLLFYRLLAIEVVYLTIYYCIYL